KPGPSIALSSNSSYKEKRSQAKFLEPETVQAHCSKSSQVPNVSQNQQPGLSLDFFANIDNWGKRSQAKPPLPGSYKVHCLEKLSQAKLLEPGTSKDHCSNTS